MSWIKRRRILISLALLLLMTSAIGYVANKRVSQTNSSQQSDFAASEMNMSTLNCKSDFDCFISAATECRLAKMTRSMTVRLFAFEVANTSTLEIRGWVNHACSFYVRTDENRVLLSPGVASQQQGAFEEGLSRVQKLSKLVEKRDGVCTFTTVDLVALLNRWKEGTIRASSDYNNQGDFAAASCSGPYFDYSDLRDQF